MGCLGTTAARARLMSADGHSKKLKIFPAG
jgi:hypothetical protein